MSNNVAVVGIQWGDEGKGKIVDWLSSRADVVVRFQGGHNAGHTLVVDGKEYKLHLLPSGIVRKDKLSVIGNGVVVDPWALLNEIEKMKNDGVEITPETLVLAENANLILPVHQILDQVSEKALGKSSIGTTGRGIGPAYEDKMGRRGLRVCDLRDPALVKLKLESMMVRHNALLKGFGEEPVSVESMYQSLMDISSELLPYAGVLWKIMNDAVTSNKKILFEGAQGIMLDIDHGTYPYVTSSNTVSSTASSGSGTGMKTVGYVLGIAKAYTTRVGSGPFPTELDNEIGDKMVDRGHEFGTTTGRRRRCGWFDATLVRQAAKVAGVDGIAMTKLDVLDGFETVSICTGYELNGEKIDHLPSSPVDQAKVVPVLEHLPGWSEITRGARSWSGLPKNAVDYIRRVEELIEVPISMLSTSPERDDTILMQDPFGE